MSFQVGDRVRVAKWAGWRRGYSNLKELEGVLCGEVVAIKPHPCGRFTVDWDADQFDKLNPRSDSDSTDWKVTEHEIEHYDNLFAAP